MPQDRANRLVPSLCLPFIPTGGALASLADGAPISSWGILLYFGSYKTQEGIKHMIFIKVPRGSVGSASTGSGPLPLLAHPCQSWQGLCADAPWFASKLYVAVPLSLVIKTGLGFRVWGLGFGV